jgi:hypothetical protein
LWASIISFIINVLIAVYNPYHPSARFFPFFGTEGEGTVFK